MPVLTEEAPRNELPPYEERQLDLRTDKLEYLALALVDPPDLDFREKRSESLIERMVTTLQKGGELNPIRVVRKGGRYRIKSGMTRFLAYGQAGRTTLPAVIAEGKSSPFDDLVDAYWENTDRQDLSRLEKAAQGLAMMKAGGLTQRAVAPILRMSEGQFSKLLTTYEKASEHVKEMLTSAKLHATFAEKLAAIPDHAVQDDLCDRAIKFGWKRHLLQKEIAGVLGKPVGRAPRKKTYQDEDGFYMKYPANWTPKQTEDAFKKALKKFRHDGSGGPGSSQPMA